MLRELIAAQEKVFPKGELEITPDKFTNCGLCLLPLNEGCSMDQMEHLRPKFVSELQAAISATDTALLFGLTLREITVGPVTPRQQGMCLRDEGSASVKVRVCIDAMSMFSARSVNRAKPPAEKSFFATRCG